ncbi:uncharacterized protein LOC134205910 [Armigeres subalbatus]|uniref:uncharacterized protein LOC134205910 n=1 Tax=Armigeres subalbatus TaxID=124917 RepID=UPI002ED42588
MANEGKYVRPVGSLSEEGEILNDEEENLIVGGDSASRNTSTDHQADSNSDSADDTSSSSDSENYVSDIGDSNATEKVTCITSPSSGTASQASNYIESHLIPETVSVGNTSSDITEQARNTERMDRMEKMIAGINEALMRFQPTPRTTPSESQDNSWNLSNDVNSCTNSSGSNSSSIRWEHIKPFLVASLPTKCGRSGTATSKISRLQLRSAT